MATTEPPAVFLRRFLDSYEAQDFDRLWDFYAPDCDFPVLRRFGLDDDWPTYRTFMAAFVTAFPDVHHHIEHVVADGDDVWALYTMTGTHRGPFRGIAPTGRTVRYALVAMYRIVEDRIASADFLSDELAVRQQLGATA